MQSELHQRALDTLRRGDANNALIMLGQALQLGESSELWNDWAATSYRLQRLKEAELGFRRALQLDAKNSAAAANLSSLLEHARLSEETRRDATIRKNLKEQLERLYAQPAKPQRAGRNLVMGTGTNYGKKELGPFVSSLRRSGFLGDIVLFVSELDRETQQFLAAHAVKTELWDGMFLPFDVQLGRFITYYNFLQRMSRGPDQPYDYVFLTDVRDVLFQQDPFSPEPKSDMLAFLEDDSQSLGSCVFNSNWIRSAFGEAELGKVAAERISCSGTVLGSWRGILAYLLTMQIMITEMPRPTRFIKGIDQGLHNVMLSRQLLRSCDKVRNGERVLTLGYVAEQNVRINDEGKIVDPNGHVIPVIHQYDRHPKVAGLMEKALEVTVSR